MGRNCMLLQSIIFFGKIDAHSEESFKTPLSVPAVLRNFLTAQGGESCFWTKRFAMHNMAMGFFTLALLAVAVGAEDAGFAALVHPDEASCPPNALRGGTHRRTVFSGGRFREYKVVVPIRYNNTAPLRLVVAVHCYTCSAVWFLQQIFVGICFCEFEIDLLSAVFCDRTRLKGCLAYPAM